MINEIKRELERKEKVYIELVDPNGLRDRGDFQESLIQDLLDSDKLQVLDAGLGIHDNLVKVRLHNSCRAILIDEENLVFFEMTPESATFDDLVDVAVQAKRDGVVYSVDWDSSLTVKIDSDRAPIVIACEKVSGDFIEDAIRSIESCYTETFVIDDVSDILNCKGGASVVFSNGVEGEFLECYVDVATAGVLFLESGKGFNVPFELFKGATVTQRKTNN